MKQPVKHGDTHSRAHHRYRRSKAPSQPDRGVVTFARRLRATSDGEEVQEMEVTIMYRRRPQVVMIQNRRRRDRGQPSRKQGRTNHEGQAGGFGASLLGC